MCLGDSYGLKLCLFSSLILLVPVSWLPEQRADLGHQMNWSPTSFSSAAFSLPFALYLHLSCQAVVEAYITALLMTSSDDCHTHGSYLFAASQFFSLKGPKAVHWKHWNTDSQIVKRNNNKQIKWILAWGRGGTAVEYKVLVSTL